MRFEVACQGRLWGLSLLYKNRNAPRLKAHEVCEPTPHSSIFFGHKFRKSPGERLAIPGKLNQEKANYSPSSGQSVDSQVPSSVYL